MPLNEASAPLRSNLTAKQKQEAMAAIYGLASSNPNQEPTMSPSQGPPHFSDHEIERMRTILAHHDSQKKATEVYDLNNPPRTNYVHQHYPKLVYAGPEHPANPPYKRVENAQEHEAAMADGWLNEPGVPVEDGELELDPADAAEVAAIDKKLAEAKAEAKLKAAKKAATKRKAK